MGKRTKSGGASAPPPPPPPPGGEGLFAGDSWHDWLPFYSEAKLLNKVFVTPALEHAQWLTTREAWEFLGARAYVLLLVDIPEQAKMFVNGVNWKLDDPTPKDIVIIFVLVYWVLKILYGLFSSVRKRIRGEANKGEVEGKAFRGPPLGFVGSNKKNALKESKKRKGRRTRSFLSRVWSKLKFFLFICGIQYCISGSGGMADMDMQFMKLLVAGQVRESAQAFINELLPKPTWQREPLLSWARLISVTYVLYYFFTNLMEQSDMLLYQDSVACVLFNTFDIGLDLLHLEMWLKWPMQLLFVAYWRFGNEHTLTFVLFANIFIVRIVSAITRYLGERMREPYSIVMPVIVGLPTLASFVYPFWIVNTFGANIKKMGVIHKKKQFILAKAIFNIRSSKSLYAILGVPEYSDAKVIKKAFRDASRTLHPDKNPDPKAQALFLKMQEAYNALKGGSVEQMRLQQRESNERDLNTLNDIMILGMMYAMSYFLFNVLLIFAKELWTYLSKKQGLRESNKAKNAYLQDEWERLLASQVTLETYIRTGKNRDIQDQATKWLHPLKRAIAFRAKNDFRRPYDEEELKERLGNLKRDLLGIKEKKVEPLDIAPAGPSDDGPSVQLPLPVHEAEEVGSSKMKKLEKSAIDKVCWGLVHRLRCLIHKRVLLTIYLEDVSKQDTDALEGIQKDLDDTIVSYTEEINKFAQLEAVDVAIDLDKHVENVDSYSRAIRYRFRKELRKGKEERLEWIKALLSGPWYEYEMHRYCAPTKY